LQDVIDHYNVHLELGLTEKECKDLAEYLKSLQALTLSWTAPWK
jgi:hypothetical protein